MAPISIRCSGGSRDFRRPANEMKKTLAHHIACGVAELSKLRCNGCEIDHPRQIQYDFLLPDDILFDMHFDEAVEIINSNAVIRDWLTLLLEVDLRQSDVAPEQLDAIKSWLEESPLERWRNNVKRVVLPLWKTTSKYVCFAERQ